MSLSSLCGRRQQVLVMRKGQMTDQPQNEWEPTQRALYASHKSSQKPLESAEVSAGMLEQVFSALVDALISSWLLVGLRVWLRVWLLVCLLVGLLGGLLAWLLMMLSFACC